MKSHFPIINYFEKKHIIYEDIVKGHGTHTLRRHWGRPPAEVSRRYAFRTNIIKNHKKRSFQIFFVH